MEEFLYIYGLERINQDEINNINKQMIYTEIEDAIKNLPTKKAQIQMD